MQVIDVQAAKALLEELLDAVLQGQEVVVTRDDKPIARLVPMLPLRPRPRFGSARGPIHLSDDFDAPLADFEPYAQ